MTKKTYNKQIPCSLTYTNKKVHEIFSLSPLSSSLSSTSLSSSTFSKNSAMISSPISIPVLEQDEVAADRGVEGSIMDPSPVSKPALVDENDNEDENEEEFEDVTEINIDHFNDDSGEWVPKLMQSEDPNHRAFVDKNGKIAVYCGGIFRVGRMIINHLLGESRCCVPITF